VHLGWTNLEGDGQADTKHHGGPDKAVCVYPYDRLGYWAERLGRDVAPGAFGGNVTAVGQDETTVCIGDIYAVGEAIVQVSQPRSPCWKLARYWSEKKLALWVQKTGYTGWYLRVLETGCIAAGQALRLEERPHPTWTVMRANEVRYHATDDTEQAAELAGCEALGTSWRATLRRRAERAAQPDDVKRLVGPNRD